MNFPDSPGKEEDVLTTGTEIWIGQGLVDKAECSPFIWTFFGYLRCTDSLSELESIGRCNLTWPASPATELGRTVLLPTFPMTETRAYYLDFSRKYLMYLKQFISPVISNSSYPIGSKNISLPPLDGICRILEKSASRLQKRRRSKNLRD